MIFVQECPPAPLETLFLCNIPSILILHKKKWNDFVSLLQLCFIHLEEDAKDKLVWTKNPATGDFTTKLGYKSWELEHYQGDKSYWWKQVWKSEVPLKAKITLWMALNNKILTWENLKKRGWNGPSWCALCHSDEEIGSHLFVVCSYAELVWKKYCKEIKFQGT